MRRLFSYLVCTLAWAEVLLVLLSWILSATMTEHVHSLLSSEGIRWFFSSFSTMLASPWLVWLLLLAMAGGCLWQSGILSHLPSSLIPHPSSFFPHPSALSPQPSSLSPLTYRHRMAFRTTVVIVALYVVAILALTVVPHAVLLSATGQLFPSPFSRALVPIVSFGVLLASAVYGWASGRFTSFADVIASLAYGIQQAAPLFILYVVAVQFYASLRFVF